MTKDEFVAKVLAEYYVWSEDLSSGEGNNDHI